jgi:hypothetical protein
LCGLIRAELERDRRLKEEDDSLPHPSSRVLYKTPEFVVIHPFASRAPFETWILPRTHQSSFDELAKEQSHIEALANVLTWTLGRLYICLDDPAYNMVFKTSPFPAPEHQEDFRFYHWYIVIEPQRLVTPGGYELSTGIPVNVAPPESDVDGDGSVTWKGSAEFFRSRGVLFGEDKNKIGTLRWYLERPKQDEELLNIRWEAKQRTLRNILTVLRREGEPSTGTDSLNKLSEYEEKMLRETEERVQNNTAPNE